MLDTVQALYHAILDDDRARAKALLKKEPTLALQPVTAKHRLEAFHWIYADDTPLHVAAASYRVEIARDLLAAGADFGAAKNHRRSQPLHYAADGHFESPVWNPRRQVAMLKLLLKAGADIDAQDKNGATPLHRAVRTRCAAAVQTLIEAGADVTRKNLPGSTPFHLAVQNTGRGGSGEEQARAAQMQIIQAFVKRGVSADTPDARGKTVRDWAKSEWIRKFLAG